MILFIQEKTSSNTNSVGVQVSRESNHYEATNHFDEATDIKIMTKIPETMSQNIKNKTLCIQESRFRPCLKIPGFRLILCKPL